MPTIPDYRRLMITCAVLVVALLPGPDPLQAQQLQAQQDFCDLNSEDGAVFGSVSDRMSKVALPGVTVTATWVSAGQTTPADRPNTDPTSPTPLHDNLTAVTGGNGNFAICAVPPNTSVTVSLEIAGFFEEQTVTVSAGAITEAYFSIDLSEQSGGRVVGRVLDLKTNRPVTAASVSLLSADGEAGPWNETLSDAQGRFAVNDVYPGSYSVTIQHVGYDDVAEFISVPARHTVEVNAQMSADPIELAPIVVTALRDRFLENKGFYERMDWSDRLSRGHFYQRADIERRNPIRIGHLLLEVPSLRCSNGMSIRQSCMISSSRTPGCEYLAVWVDGVEVVQPPRGAGLSISMRSNGSGPPPQPIDEIVLPIDVQAIEVYPTPSSVPAEFAGMNARCGAIAIWTRRG